MSDFVLVIPTAVLAFTVASILIELTPGPNMTYLAIVSASRGRASGFATVAGVATGLALIGIAGALGATALIQASPVLYEALRWAGFLFLLYLAWDAWIASPQTDGSTQEFSRFFKRGFLTNVLNPKAAVFYVTVLPSFTDADKPVLAQTLLLTAIYVAVATAIHLLIVIAAGALTPILTDERRERIVRRVLAVLLACVALWFFLGAAR